MKPFYKKSFQFWFILLVIAFINAIVRETTYKPLLSPYIGMWAHQLSSLTGILLFYGAIYFFLKRIKTPYARRDLVKVGLMWIAMTVIFESFMNSYIRKLTFEQVLQTYYFWKGDTWFFVLLSLLVSPLIAHKILGRK
jgi:hypothetical protein